MTLPDYIEFFRRDSGTAVSAIYVESIQEGRRFAETVQKHCLEKPLVVFRGGTTNAGKRAASSHTGAIASDQRLLQTVLRVNGAIVARDLEELFDFAMAFDSLPLPKGSNVGIISAGGGYGVLSSDAAESFNLKVQDLSKETLEIIDEVLPPYWSRGNPVDTVGTFRVDVNRTIVEALMKQENIDCIWLLGLGSYSFLASTFTESPLLDEKTQSQTMIVQEMEVEVVKDLLSMIKKYNKPVYVTSLLHGSISPPIKILEDEGIPIFRDPGRMASCTRLLLHYSNFLAENSS